MGEPRRYRKLGARAAFPVVGVHDLADGVHVRDGGFSGERAIDRSPRDRLRPAERGGHAGLRRHLAGGVVQREREPCDSFGGEGDDVPGERIGLLGIRLGRAVEGHDGGRVRRRRPFRRLRVLRRRRRLGGRIRRVDEKGRVLGDGVLRLLLQDARFVRGADRDRARLGRRRLVRAVRDVLPRSELRPGDERVHRRAERPARFVHARVFRV
mmetsp:Transcript_10255/g.43594  ORF Transcript_10255/g.43594 Transcript_10255/m.43594 type:complete len:211 (+) Transcript_10255:1884-2516(+)